ncbi:hypothetical protein G7Z17_g11043 [Cylindrodendrum hubeiense]|uniref:Zn(2)-C6 fungal-type domain-containing protein n=1 Tax=Cylindrodendrum hubeiense TaxID=595255 RepID=A0A9P5H0B5_9HYPO|nr:hypothetical protein G7Z17_g11043 [Cylindrodendrum hubeiense]
MPGDTSESTPRNTQRAPRSCRSCASRKVKCDKHIPCSKCVRRGDAESCSREMVMVRGMVTSAKDPSSTPSYQELLKENNRLRDALGAVNSKALDQSDSALSTRRRKPHHLLENLDVLDSKLLAPSSPPVNPPQKLQWAHIILPGRECSEALIAFDKTWNSWAHYALEYPTFEHEHDDFMNSIENGASLSDMDPAWLSVYFSVITTALLMADEDYALTLHLPGDPQALLHNWALSLHVFTAAIFLLRESKAASPTENVDFSKEVEMAISYLDEIKSRNLVADKASKILRIALAEDDIWNMDTGVESDLSSFIDSDVSS